MKNYILKIVFASILCLTSCLFSMAQTINWNNSSNYKHQVNAFVGAEYGLIYGASYSYHVNNRLFPVWITADITLPIGKKIFDDYKAKVGAEVNWFKFNNIHLTTGIHGIFRRFENDYVGISNFGMDLNGKIGYYKTNWFAAAELGFDKAIASRYSHTDQYKEAFPQVKDGWIEPAHGGNFNYGINTGFSFKNNDISLRAGKLINQSLKSQPLLPFYGTLGFSHNF